jgi:hypothetical protein
VAGVELPAWRLVRRGALSQSEAGMWRRHSCLRVPRRPAVELVWPAALRAARQEAAPYVSRRGIADNLCRILDDQSGHAVPLARWQ